MIENSADKARICFIVSSIGEEGGSTRRLSDDKFEFVYAPVCAAFRYNAVRADQMRTSNRITTDIIERIVNSELVIADVSGDNPNVFYELAVRNAVNKPVILVRDVGQKLPFDVFDKRAVSLDMSDNRQWNKAKEELIQVFESVEANPIRASESILSNFSFDIVSAQQKTLAYSRTIIDSKQCMEKNRSHNVKSRFA